MVVNCRFSLEQAQRVMKDAEEYPYVESAVKVLEKCCDEYEGKEIFLSFNGGKDCTAVLHLTASVFRLREVSPLLCLYVTEDPFAEVDAFVEEAANYYGSELARKKKPMKAALTTLRNERPALKAALMGTRKSDPGSERLETFSPTDPGWPKLMRVFPVLDWSYERVWQFLRNHDVPYCGLYDRGYTSIGSRSTTSPNPSLRISEESYLPAYMLDDGTNERRGRR